MTKKSFLGKVSTYPSQYDAGLLCPVERAEARQQLSLPSNLPFHGVDRWTAYEASWLDAQGKPQVAIAEFVFDCQTPCIVESKSFKLYLNSFNQTVFKHPQALIDCWQKDLSEAIGANAVINVFPVSNSVAIESPTGECIDHYPVAIEHYQPKALYYKLLRKPESAINSLQPFIED